MLVLLHGAIKNAGDFLIFERARALLRTYRPNDQFVVLPRWESLEPHLDKVNAADAVVLCGGPGYASDFYPGVFPLTKDLSAIKPPIVPLGLGWSGWGAENGRDFAFTPEALRALTAIHERIRFSSVRDVLTQSLLTGQGLENVLMTGCPAWYHLPSLEKEFQRPVESGKVVVSGPARIVNAGAAVRVMRWVKRRFPRSTRYLVFHRGIWPDRRTPASDYPLNPFLASCATALGFRVVNAAYSTSKIKFYKDCDFHVGFRVHAHICFLSHRRTSVLVHEDGRGAGQTATLKTIDISLPSSNLEKDLDKVWEGHQQTGFRVFEDAFDTMRRTHTVMKQFIESF